MTKQEITDAIGETLYECLYSGKFHNRGASEMQVVDILAAKLGISIENIRKAEKKAFNKNKK